MANTSPTLTLRPLTGLAGHSIENEPPATGRTRFRPELPKGAVWAPLQVQKWTGEWVYFLQPVGGGHIKIGVSSRPMGRKRDHENGQWYELRFLGITPGDRDFENEMHRRLDEHCVRGEWFRDAPEVRATIELLCRDFKYDLDAMLKYDRPL